jgi:hypothetical protein
MKALDILAVMLTLSLVATSALAGKQNAGQVNQDGVSSATSGRQPSLPPATTPRPSGANQGVPAGPHAADEIVQQNPEITKVPGVPSNLKGASVQNCPTGRTPDISHNQCVVTYVPPLNATSQTFILILHPDSPKVWLVLQGPTANQGTAKLLGEFDLKGNLLPSRAIAPTADNSQGRGSIVSNTKPITSRGTEWVEREPGLQVSPIGTCIITQSWKMAHPGASIMGMRCGPDGWCSIDSPSCQTILQNLKNPGSVSAPR